MFGVQALDFSFGRLEALLDICLLSLAGLFERFDKRPSNISDCEAASPGEAVSWVGLLKGGVHECIGSGKGVRLLQRCGSWFEAEIFEELVDCFCLRMLRAS